MAHNVLISLLGPDRVGLVAAVTGRLFDLGANLGDTSFAVLGTGYEFTSVAEVPDELTAERIADELRALPILAGSNVAVTDFMHEPVHDESGRVTHRIRVAGGDRPGLVARLTEVFVEFEANVVRMNSERVPEPGGVRYATVFHVSIPGPRAAGCLAAVANTAEQLQMTCTFEET